MDEELAALYRRDLRDWAARVRNDKRLISPDITVTQTSRTCGSTVTLDVRREGGLIEELGWRTRACTLGMAATGIVVRNAVGQSFGDVAAVGDLLERFLSGEDVSFPKPWQDLEAFVAARSFPTRHNSIMLAFDAIVAAALSTEKVSASPPDHIRDGA